MRARSPDGQNDAEPRDYLVCHGHSVCPLTPSRGFGDAAGQSHPAITSGTGADKERRRDLDKRVLQHQAAYLAIPPEAPLWDDLIPIHTRTHVQVLSEPVRPRPRLHAVVPRAFENVLPAFGMYRPSARP